MSRLEEVRDSVLAHPLHSACQLELLSAGEGRSEVRFAVNDFTANPMGALHGGILYALMDVACFFAVVPSLSADQQPVTVETHSSVLRAAMKGESVVIRARLDRLGRTLGPGVGQEALAVNASGEERLIATGSVTKAITDIR